jgi:hypothetical protein
MIDRLFNPIPDATKAIERTHNRRLKAADRLVAKAQKDLESAKRKARRSAKSKPQKPAPDDWETPLTIKDWE